MSLIYALLVSARRLAYQKGWIKTKPVSLPVVVVGNLSVGGTGKTPLCGRLVEMFTDAGWRPAIVSRGYGGQRHERPYLVTQKDTASIVGDEPLMLYQSTNVPVCVCSDRAAAVEHVATETQADIVFSDDGLQHLAMPRVAQVIVVDALRGFGNRWLLPAGPLRDKLVRLRDATVLAFQVPHDNVSARHESLKSEYSIDLVKHACENTFYLQLTAAIALGTGNRVSLDEFKQGKVHAVAGIGNPQRFFAALRHRGLHIIEHPKQDHHVFCTADVDFQDQYPVLVTSKDAVKLRSLTALPQQLYEVPTRVLLSDALEQQLLALEQTLSHYRKSKDVQNIV